MYRAIKLNKYKFSDIQITERLSVLQKGYQFYRKCYQFYRKCYQFYRKKFAIHCKFYSETREICNALQISRKSFVYLQRISFLAIKIECKMNSKVNK